MFCSNCGAQLSDGAAFCSNCGARINTVQEPTVQEPTVQNQVVQQPRINVEGIRSNIAEGVQKVKENELVKSVKQDLGNSSTVNVIKTKVSSTAEKVKEKGTGNGALKNKKTKVIAIVAVAILAVVIIVSNIHTCQECDEAYFGKKYEISFWGETEVVCKDCYNDWHSFF